jgi:hypothetical protein
MAASRWEEALAELHLCSSRMPRYIPCLLSLAAVGAETGRIEEARSAVSAMLQDNPNLTVRDSCERLFFRDPGMLEYPSQRLPHRRNARGVERLVAQPHVISHCQTISARTEVGNVSRRYGGCLPPWLACHGASTGRPTRTPWRTCSSTLGGQDDKPSARVRIGNRHDAGIEDPAATLICELLRAADHDSEVA